jgi:hypothetical protein
MFLEFINNTGGPEFAVTLRVLAGKTFIAII